MRHLQILMMCTLVLILSGCSQKAIVNQSPVYVSIPINLLSDPCSPVEAGDTLSSLAQGYVTNTGCVGEYRIRLKKLAEWDAEQRAIYKPQTK